VLTVGNRRKKPTCGDIDILLTHPDYKSGMKKPNYIKQWVDKLKKINLLTDDISNGTTVYHGVCKLSDKADALHRY
jgi:DNA polymerase/3'-5' exonuclease PolX